MLKKENLEQLIQKLEAQHTKLRIFNEAYENNKNRIKTYIKENSLKKLDEFELKNLIEGFIIRTEAFLKKTNEVNILEDEIAKEIKKLNKNSISFNENKIEVINNYSLKFTKNVS